MRTLKLVFFCAIVILLSACGERRPLGMTPEEAAAYQSAEDRRVKEMLSETAPRNQNNLPKAVPEFRAWFPGIGSE